ncbi:hypothetical protein [Paenibacillus sp. 7541]|uniref:hypothetical protein n=1 Tax=Paenibacillus sp. 7541 TaxID=2026236 RepID=UPI001140DB2F|nr:hypothetical protein [Paenibacillus sp. 7541]
MMSNTYANHRIPEASLQFTGVNGTYFNESAFFFYHKRSSSNNRDQILYTRVRLKPQKDKEVLECLEANGIAYDKLGYNVNGHREISNLASVVHLGILYVFWTEDGHIHYVTSTDGKAWSPSVQLPYSFIRRTQFAALSVHGRLILLGAHHANSENRIGIVYQDDNGVWRIDANTAWKNVKHVCACAYAHPGGYFDIMVGVVTTHANLWTAIFRSDIGVNPGTGSGLRQIADKHHEEQDGRVDFLAIEAGTVEDGVQDPSVQLFINGWHRPHSWAGYKNNQMKTYNILTGEWSKVFTRTHGHTKYPTWVYMGAFQYFVPIGTNGEMRQEIWLYMNYNDENFVKQGGSNLVLCRYKSDVMRFVNREEEKVKDDFRALVGVIEGAPPYVTNGSTRSEYGSTFYYGRSSTEQIAISTRFQMGSYMQAGPSLPVGAEASVKFSAQQADHSSEISEITRHIDKTIVPIPGENSVTYVYLTPHIVRTTYELYDWKMQKPFGVRTYVFHTSKADIDFDVLPILHTYVNQPNTHDYTTFLQRFPSVPHYADVKQSLALDVSWVPGETSAFFEKKTSSVNITSSTVSGEITAGYSGILSMGGNTSFEYELSHSSEVAEKIGVKLDYPYPRAGHPGDVRKLILRMLMLVPDAEQIDSCYWIPKDKQNQRPWCVAWSIQEVKLQESSD